MSVALISFCSFLSGVGSCAAFQAALKTGMLPILAQQHSVYSPSQQPLIGQHTADRQRPVPWPHSV